MSALAVPRCRRPGLPLLLALLLMPPITMAQTRATLTPDSRITIRGTSSVSTFGCTADQVEGHGTFSPDAPAQAVITVPVAAFDCGNPRMNHDLRTALQAQRHPHIRFVLDEAALDGTATENPVPLRVAGTFRLAGAEQPVALHVEARPGADGTYRVTGSVPLRMSAFGITPPTALLGLVRVRDAITVHFDLVARLEPAAR